MPWNQSFARWCYSKTPLAELCEMARAIGFAGIDLVEPAEWKTLDSFGLVCSLCPSHPINKGLNDPANHERCETLIRDAIDESAAGGCPNVVCFSGNRDAKNDGVGAIDDEAGSTHCVDVLKRLAGYAEAKRVTLCLELLNSKDHKGYMADRTAWGVDVCRRVGSERVKLLYDVYHMQRMEGDLVATIREHGNWFGHIHTAGVPGRNELHLPVQEIHYPAIFAALKSINYTGWIGHEFLPTIDVGTGLRKAFEVARGA